MARMQAGVWIAILIGTSVCGPCLERGKNGTRRQRLQKRSLLFVEKTACYRELGCFSNGPPFYHPVYRPLSLPPQAPEVIKTTFLLYTRRNKHRPIFLSTRNVKKSTFDPSSLTRVIIHGFYDNQYFTSWFQRLKDILLDRADENVLIVDWTGSNRLPYSVAVANSRLVGAQIAHFIAYLYKSMGVSPESFHLIGHSLGAHVAGYAGERLHKLGRISGLDPAGPFFRNVAENVRLDPSDAVFVDVIHSDPGVSILQGFGSPEDAGDLDFFPGGGNPPGCEQTFARSVVEDQPTEALGNLFACQHLRSYEYFIYSFNHDGCLFVGVECSSWKDFLSGHCNCGHDGGKCAIMGIFSPTYAFPSGRHYKDRRMYLKVGPERPFCVHQYQIIVHVHTISDHQTYGYEAGQADITVKGSLEKLKGRLHIGINLAERRQVKKFLLSSDLPIGEVQSASLTLGELHAPQGSGHYRGRRHFRRHPDSVIEKIEVNYLYPLPKKLTSSQVCRASEERDAHGDKRFVFSPHVCY